MCNNEDLFCLEPLASLIADGLLIVRDGQLLVPGNLTAAQETELAERLKDHRHKN